MITRILGRTSLQVSVLGVGGHTYPVGDGPNDPFERKGDTINFRPPDAFLEQVVEELGEDGQLPPAG